MTTQTKPAPIVAQRKATPAARGRAPQRKPMGMRQLVVRELDQATANFFGVIQSSDAFTLDGAKKAFMSVKSSKK